MPLRPLLSTKNVFVWTEDHSRSVRARVKKVLTSPPVLTTFDVTRPTRLRDGRCQDQGPRVRPEAARRDDGTLAIESMPGLGSFPRRRLDTPWSS